MIRSRADAMFARDQACIALGISLDDVSPGRATLAMRIGTSMVNGHGIAHGGYLFLLADAAFAYASNSHGPLAVAQSALVTFVQPARVGDVLMAQATERSRHGRAGIYDVSITRPVDDGLVAEFRGHSVILAGNPFAAQAETDPRVHA